jgi:branched-subunit amino acid ABC-type transport system permease component
LTSSLGPWFDYTINGLVVGNIYALLAVGLALIYGVSHLINFAHGSIYMVGAYIGWLCITYLATPLPVTLLCVVVGCGILGMAIERIGLRPLQNSPRIAPLLSTIGIGLVLDQVAQLLFTPDPRGLPSQLPDWRIQIGGGTIGALDILIAGIGLVSALALYLFLRFTKLGWAVRATALDRDAAQQCGVDVNRVNSAGVRDRGRARRRLRLLVGMYYNSIDPNMGFHAGLKGIVAQMIGGMGNVPGAIAGSLLLGLIESYGIAAFGTSYRNLFAFVVMILILVLKPNGIFSRGRGLPPEPLTGTFIAPSAPLRIPWAVVAGARGDRAGAAAGRAQRLRAADARHRVALRRAGDQSYAGRRYRRHDLARTGRAARDRRLCVGPARDHLQAPGRDHDPGGGLHHRAARHLDHLPVIPATWTLRDHRDARRRRDRDAGDPELGQPDPRPGRPHGHSAALVLRRAAAQWHMDLRDRALRADRSGAAAMAPALLASRADLAGDPRRRRRGAQLRHRARPLQGALRSALRDSPPASRAP